MNKRYLLAGAAVLAVAVVVTAVRSCESKPDPGTIDDEAKVAGRGPETLPAADEDYYRDMDGGATLVPAQVAATLQPFVPGISPADAVAAVAKGRNNWIAWSGGNDRFWDEISRASFGALDFLKTLSNHPSLHYSRDDRWKVLGLVNEPGFEKGTGPRTDRYGLWLDVRQKGVAPDPFENETKYPGVRIGARGQNIPTGSYYGYASGIVGLRLFPNPAFDKAAEAKWDPVAYYTKPEYYNRKDLVKPYRVGMSCGFCHVGPSPTRPPENPEHPEWANLNSNPGAQYFWVDRIFFWDVDKSNYVYQMFHTSRPGALDTSLVSSDNINNPRTMNAVYNLAPRLEIGRKLGQEMLAGGGLDNAQFNDTVGQGPLAAFFSKPATVWTPHVLKDGADSVGALGALNRVFVNIGLFSEEWLLHFRPLVGGRHITPFRIDVARKNSNYWVANERQTLNTALFFLATAKPDRLQDAPSGGSFLDSDAAKMERGKVVFAERCARCHSSKLPDKAASFFPADSIGPKYLEHWNAYWAWTKTPEFRTKMEAIVLAPDFLDNNFLSTDLRVPVTLLETNACSPSATNGIEGNIWDNFTSQSYKSLPSVGAITVHDPFTGEAKRWTVPGGGRGYTRPPSLVSVWSTAPYLLNNTVGEFRWSGSVKDRMASFEDGIEKMLWPEKRDGDFVFSLEGREGLGKDLHGIVDRTTDVSYLRISYGFLPEFLRSLLGWRRFLPWVDKDAMALEIGPIPKGTPVNLIANIDVNADEGKLLALAPRLIGSLLRLKLNLRSDDTLDEVNRKAAETWKPLVPDLLEVNKCPDFVVNRGHYFGTRFLDPKENEPGLSDDDKRALIEFLKRF